MEYNINTSQYLFTQSCTGFKQTRLTLHIFLLSLNLKVNYVKSLSIWFCIPLCYNEHLFRRI